MCRHDKKRGGCCKIKPSLVDSVAFRSRFLGTAIGDGYNDNNTSVSIQEKDQLWMEWNIMCRMFVSLTIYAFLVYISLVLYTLHLSSFMDSRNDQALQNAD